MSQQAEFEIEVAALTQLLTHQDLGPHVFSVLADQLNKIDAEDELLVHGKNCLPSSQRCGDANGFINHGLLIHLLRLVVLLGRKF
mmetsp:Transcript_8971/g.8326  ORF Transcript_8971/g.8326 Transcript_8971/m.8326 type:complete len:85 (-) Transcript_8971:2151-2405(-)